MSAAAAAASEPIDSTSLQALMIRWKLAEQFLFDNPDAAETGKMALHVLICRDFPTLIRELVRLRPDLVERSIGSGT
jgi:hypothetical protein